MVVSLALFAARSAVPKLFSKDAAVIAMATQHLPIVAFAMVRPAAPPGPGCLPWHCVSGRPKTMMPGMCDCTWHDGWRVLEGMCCCRFAMQAPLRYLQSILLWRLCFSWYLRQWLGAVQPFDAAASILDGSLMGASETTYVGTAMVVTSAATLAVLALVTHSWPCLASVWLGMKFMTLGRIVAGAWRFASPKSRFHVGENTLVTSAAQIPA